jgi:hypothetical protein
VTEADLLGELSAERARGHVERIAGDIPSRLPGSPNCRRMADYAAQALEASGVASRVHELPALVSFPEATALEVLDAPVATLAAYTLGHSGTASAAGELADLGGGALGEYDGRDVAGKVVMADTASGPGRHEKQRLAAAHGAVGFLTLNWGRADDTRLPFGSIKPAWGNPTLAARDEWPALPSVGISRADGIALRERMRQGPVRVRFRPAVENAWRPIQVTVGEVPGSTDEFVVVGGHQDSWYGPAATDNATGSACMLELARVFARHRDRLQRGLVFAFWTGHETGTMAGSSWYVDRHWARLRRDAVAYLQIDQPACLGAGCWNSAANTELRRFQQAIDARLTEGRKRGWRRAPKVGDSSFFGVGVPMLTSLASFDEAELKATANAHWGWWHHTYDNTLDKVDWGALPLHLRVYGAYLWTLCTAPVLPFDFAPVAEEIRARLQALAQGGDPLGLDALADRAAALHAAAVRLDAADTPAKNAAVKRLSRLLLPITSTAAGTYGHDPYSYTPQGTVLPALYDAPRLSGPGRDVAERAMLETQLFRERNRVADVLEDAIETIAAALR